MDDFNTYTYVQGPLKVHKKEKIFMNKITTTTTTAFFKYISLNFNEWFSRTVILSNSRQRPNYYTNPKLNREHEMKPSGHLKMETFTQSLKISLFEISWKSFQSSHLKVEKNLLTFARACNVHVENERYSNFVVFEPSILSSIPSRSSEPTISIKNQRGEREKKEQKPMKKKKKQK